MIKGQELGTVSTPFTIRAFELHVPPKFSGIKSDEKHKGSQKTKIFIILISKLNECLRES